MPRYPFPWDLFLGLARDLVPGHRSLTSDCIEMTRRISPPPCINGTVHIPSSGALLLAANHYQRRGLWIAWPGAVITATVAARRGPEPPIHWLATGGLRWQQWRNAGPEVLGTRAMFQRVAQTYEMGALPLIGATDRSAAIRTWLRWAETGDALGIFPEGLTGRSNALRRPERGFDALVRHVNRRGIPVLPCGIHEEGEALHVSFGTCQRLDDGEAVMRAIASVLPKHIRGVYA